MKASTSAKVGEAEEVLTVALTKEVKVANKAAPSWRPEEKVGLKPSNWDFLPKFKLSWQLILYDVNFSLSLHIINGFFVWSVSNSSRDASYNDLVIVCLYGFYIYTSNFCR